MHYYKRNLGDYAKKAGRLSMLQHGAYTLLIDACYDREQFPTLDDAIDWAWASSAAEIEAVEFVLRKFFTLEGDRYVQKRIQEEVAEYRIKADTNARIAQERETKRKEKNTDRARSVDESAPEQHEAPPNHEPRTINQEPVVTTPPEGGVSRKRSAATTAARPDDVSEPVWQDFQRLRREKRAPLTDTALAGVRREAEKAGVSMEVALAYCCEAGWQGFNAGWYADRQGKRSAPAATPHRYAAAAAAIYDGVNL
jgi:uncharacterized protein YdaU (DUF1376 family)